MSNRTNEEWLADLKADGPSRQQALADLHDILLRGLRLGLLRRINTNAPEFETQAEDFVQEALLKILDNIDSFAGRSKFTTWAHKIASSVALTELRRKRWQDSSLDAIMETDDGIFTPSFAADPSPKPEKALAQAQMLRRVNQIINEDLTNKQRTALVASVIDGKSGAEVADMMDMKANAVYKLIYDARSKLKSQLEDEGLSPAEILAIFN